MRLNLVDSHCHLDFPDFADEIDQVVGRATDAGVRWMLTIGTRLDRFSGVLAIAERFAHVSCSVGVHPHEVGAGPVCSPDALLAFAEHPKVIGFGETGLDYFYENSPRDAQAMSFRAHIEASRRSGLPVIVHTRDADDDTIRILEDETAKGPFPGLIHCFTSGPRLADAALACGFYISFSGIVTFKKADEVRAVASRVPADRLLVETDAPYLAPMPHRGKRNEPAFVAETAKCIADVRGVSPGELAESSTANFFRLFTKADAARAVLPPAGQD